MIMNQMKIKTNQLIKEQGIVNATKLEYKNKKFTLNIQYIVNKI